MSHDTLIFDNLLHVHSQFDFEVYVKLCEVQVFGNQRLAIGMRMKFLQYTCKCSDNIDNVCFNFIECLIRPQQQIYTFLLNYIITDNIDDVFKGLQKIPNSQVHRKEDVPREFFYSYNRRISSLVFIQDEGYGICCYNGSSLSFTSKCKTILQIQWSNTKFIN